MILNYGFFVLNAIYSLVRCEKRYELDIKKKFYIRWSSQRSVSYN